MSFARWVRTPGRPGPTPRHKVLSLAGREQAANCAERTFLDHPGVIPDVPRQAAEGTRHWGDLSEQSVPYDRRMDGHAPTYGGQGLGKSSSDEHGDRIEVSANSCEAESLCLDQRRPS